MTVGNPPQAAGLELVRLGGLLVVVGVEVADTVVMHQVGKRLQSRNGRDMEKIKLLGCWPLVLALLAVVVLALLALFWPVLEAFRDVLTGTFRAYYQELQQMTLVLLVLMAVMMLGWLWRAGLSLVARIGVIRLENNHPINVQTLDAQLPRQALTAHYQVQALDAQRPLPQLTTYAPHIVIRGESVGQLMSHQPTPAIDVPSFGQLLADGRLGRGVPLVLGVSHESGQIVSGTFKRLYSAGLGGIQGSGKTWTAASLLAQSAMQGARLVLCDPHAGDKESLANRCSPLRPALLCDIAGDDRDILAALRLADDELRRRKGGETQRWPLIVAIDEWSALRRGDLATELPRIVEDFSTEGRKLNCHMLLLAQRWDKSSVGAFRNTLASGYIHRMRPDEARMLSGLRADMLPTDTLRLAPGQAYLLDTTGTIQKLSIPALTMEDMHQVGKRLEQPCLPETNRTFGFRPPASETNGKPAGNQPETKTQMTSSPTGSPPLDSEAARIVALFLSGKDIPSIVAEVYGVSSGRQYQQVRAKVEDILRRSLKGVSHVAHPA